MISINNCILVGRLTKEIELKKTQSNLSVTRFTLAVSRKFKNQAGEYEADFINCVAWRQSADYLNQYAKKGDMVSVIGELTTRSYDGQDGKKVYVTEVTANEVGLITKTDDAKPQSKQNDVDKSIEEYKSQNYAEYKQSLEPKKNGQQLTINTDDLPFY